MTVESPSALTPVVTRQWDRPIGRALGRGLLYVLAVGLGAMFMIPFL